MRSIVVGTAGHIDHGKSALVRALTGTDPDRLKEEKARGITIDLGFAHTSIGDTNFAFVDVPGHERFVKNMLAGAGGIDVVALVVAADESVMPQTREHFEICRLLRVPTGLVVLSKSDLADEETLALAGLDVRELVAGSFLDGAPVVAVSARDGTGLDDLRRVLGDIGSRAVVRPTEAAVRLPIDRVFSMKGFGTVVTGTLVSGRVAVDDQLTIAPGARPVKVRGVQVQGQRRNEARAGERCAVNLSGVEVADVSRGHTLVTRDAFVETRVADVAIELLPGARPLRHGARVRVHQGTAETLARVGVIGRQTEVPPGGRGFVRLRLETPAVLARGDRYILRAYSPLETIAGGAVVDPLPPRDRIRLDAAAARCRALSLEQTDESEDALRAATIMIHDAGAAALPVAALVPRVGVRPADVTSFARALETRGDATIAGNVLVETAVLVRLEQHILETLSHHHSTDPQSGGVPREELRARTFRRGHEGVFNQALARLAEGGQLLVRERIALATHRPSPTDEDTHAREAIEAAVRGRGLAPDDLNAVAAALGIRSDVADRVARLLQRQQALVRIGTLWFHADVLRQLKSDIAAMKRPGIETRIDVAAFKERYGLTRKFAIPLLEYLDRERVTRRSGDSRIVLGGA
jgi:selenocysteine-specific elongation factor